ncbi:MAG: hypothetical protein FDX30_02890 [Chlorobium sp.]|nr:MAG: hypothetical protein FDX30_02890 [Chlorobium sp.]
MSDENPSDLGKIFRDLSTLIGDFRISNWGDLTEEDRQTLEDAEWTLLNYSSDFIRNDVENTLNSMNVDLEAISKATSDAKEAVKAITSVKNVLTLTANIIALGGAITSGNVGAISGAIGTLSQTIASVK